MFAHVFLVNPLLDPDLIQLVLSAYKSTKAPGIRVKDSGKEMEMGEGGKALFRG